MTSTFGCAARQRGDWSYAGIGALCVVDEIGPLTTWTRGICLVVGMVHG